MGVEMTRSSEDRGVCDAQESSANVLPQRLSCFSRCDLVTSVQGWQFRYWHSMGGQVPGLSSIPNYAVHFSAALCLHSNVFWEGVCILPIDSVVPSSVSWTHKGIASIYEMLFSFILQDGSQQMKHLSNYYLSMKKIGSQISG